MPDAWGWGNRDQPFTNPRLQVPTMNHDLTKRKVIALVLDGHKPPYVPWSISYTYEAGEKLRNHYGVTDLEGPLQNHILGLGNDIGFFRELGDDIYQDFFGVKWNRQVDNGCNGAEFHRHYKTTPIFYSCTFKPRPLS